MLWVRSLIVVLCFAAVPAVAQEHERTPPDAHSAAPSAADSRAPAVGEASAEEHGHGPKYELLTIDGLTALWTIIVFLVLLVVIRAAAWKPIQKVLTEREKFITDSLQQAKKDREEAEARLREYGEKLESARAEATAIVAEARRDAEVVKHKIEDDGKEEAAATLVRAKREIAVATDTAVKQLYTLSADLATNVASRIIRKELDAKEHQRLIAESIEELEAASGNGRDRT
jgi:F-type H+-transporting ATPase subunit b